MIMLLVVWSVRHIRITTWLSHTVSTPNRGDDVIETFSVAKIYHHINLTITHHNKLRPTVHELTR